MDTLLAGHEWTYLQDHGIGKDEAVNWKYGYMLHPNRCELFVSSNFIDPDAEFAIDPTEVDRDHVSAKVIWNHKELKEDTFTYLENEVSVKDWYEGKLGFLHRV